MEKRPEYAHTTEEYVRLLVEANRKAQTIEELYLDATRYRRLRVLGCAPAYSKELETGSVLCFTNLDAAVDKDIAVVPSRGEA